MNGQGEWTGVC
ncbi:Protein of unknown function [Gryllus bimaculatus]|nr:Protein of unknown function [Gryllus bimaculatus]